MRTLVSYLFFTPIIILCFVSQVSAQSDRLRMAAPNSGEPSTDRFIEVLVSEVAKEGIEIEIVRGPRSPQDWFKALRDGKAEIDFALLSARAVPNLDFDPAFTYTSLITQPGLMENSTEASAIQDSFIGEAVASELNKAGVSLVAFWNRPSTAIVMRQKLSGVFDLQGLKVFSGTIASGQLLRDLGASPVHELGAELNSALRSGEIDAAETNLLSSAELNQNGTILSNYQQNPGFVLANRNEWLSLSQRVRSVMQESAEKARRASESVVRANEDSFTKLAAEYGTTYTSVASEGWTTIRSQAERTWVDQALGGNRSEAYQNLLQVKNEIQLTKGRGGALSNGNTPPVILFATNRNDEGGTNLEHRFGITKNENPLSCGRIGFLGDPGRKFGKPYAGLLELSGQTLWSGPKKCAELIEGFAGKDKGITIFFHGYWNTFPDAVRKAIAFTEDFGLQQPIIVWSWPSAGSPGEYIYDLNSVTYTEPYVQQLVGALLDKGLMRNVTVVAHSMGSRVAGQLLKSAHAKQAKLSNIVFVAADYPPSLFHQLIEFDGEAAVLKTLYANEHDSALATSEYWNSENPIGRGGKYLTKFFKNVETIDVSAVGAGGLLNHSHGFEVKPVANDVSRLLLERLNAANRGLPPAQLNGVRYWTIH